MDIIVFPEDGLNHNNARQVVEVPDPKDRIAPCDENTTFHQVIIFFYTVNVVTVLVVYKLFMLIKSMTDITWDY